MPVHIPTPEEEDNPILFAQVAILPIIKSNNVIFSFQAVQREMALELGVPATDIQSRRAELGEGLKKESEDLLHRNLS